VPAVRRLLAAASGARLCFGEPVSTAGRTVIPVARVRGGVTGGRHGRGGLNAAPVGFIELGPEGSRFEAIPDPGGAVIAVLRAGGAVAVAGGALVAARVVRRRQRALRPSRRRLLPR
jgi:hypothetical protein